MRALACSYSPQGLYRNLVVDRDPQPIARVQMQDAYSDYT
jgi:hypothetical protein